MKRNLPREPVHTEYFCQVASGIRQKRYMDPPGLRIFRIFSNVLVGDGTCSITCHKIMESKQSSSNSKSSRSPCCTSSPFFLQISTESGFSSTPCGSQPLRDNSSSKPPVPHPMSRTRPWAFFNTYPRYCPQYRCHNLLNAG